jgi:hypothetical protein
MIWSKLPWTDYEVSSCGKVRSIYAVIIKSNGVPYTRKSVVLKDVVDDGYKHVAFKHNGKHKTFLLHRLVAEAFLGASKLQVNHKDGNKLNNSIDNLEYCTASENVKHAFRTGLAFGRKGEANKSSKISEMQALTIKTLLMAGIGPIKIAREMGISKNITKDISRNKTWTHL